MQTCEQVLQITFEILSSHKQYHLPYRSSCISESIDRNQEWQR